MGVSPSECAQLTMWEYEALLVNWNLQHDPDGDLPTITADDWAAERAYYESRPELLH